MAILIKNEIFYKNMFSYMVFYLLFYLNLHLILFLSLCISRDIRWKSPCKARTSYVWPSDVRWLSLYSVKGSRITAYGRRPSPYIAGGRMHWLMYAIAPYHWGREHTALLKIVFINMIIYDYIIINQKFGPSDDAFLDFVMNQRYWVYNWR